jgi:hypothetical protein
MDERAWEEGWGEYRRERASMVESGSHKHRHEHDQNPEQPGYPCWTREGATQITQGEQTMQTSLGLDLCVACPYQQTEDQHGEDERDGPGIEKSLLVVCIVCSPESSSTERTTWRGTQPFNSQDAEADGQRETDAIFTE